MKRILLISLLVVIIKAGICQIPVAKGDYLVGGSISASSITHMNISGSSEVNSTMSYSVSLYPTAGMFLTDKFVIGISPNIYIYKRDTSINETNLIISGFGRFYIQNIFLHGGIGLGLNNYDFGSGANKSILFSIDLGTGYAYFINDNVSLDIMLKLHSQARSYTNSENINATARLSVNIGFQIYL